MDFTFIGNDKLQLLAHNYWYLFDLYRLGKFETRLDPEKFQYYQPGVGTSISQTLKPAADDLYLLAEVATRSWKPWISVLRGRPGGWRLRPRRT